MSNTPIGAPSAATVLSPHERFVLADASLTTLAYVLARSASPYAQLIVVPDDEHAQQLAGELALLGAGETVVLPGEPHSPFSEVLSDSEASRTRLALRERMLSGVTPQIIVAAATALQGRWMPEEAFKRARIVVRRDHELERDKLARALVACGYLPVPEVEDEGTFSLRGGVMDVFVPEAEAPVRIDWFGDDVAGLFHYDVATGRPLRRREELSIAPIREVVFDEESRRCAHAWLDAQKDSSNTPTRDLRRLQEQVAMGEYFFGIEALWPVFYEHTESVATALGARDVVRIVWQPEAVVRAWQERYARAEAERDKAAERNRVQADIAAHLMPTDALEALLVADATLIAAGLLERSKHRPLKVRINDVTPLANALEERRKTAGKGEPLAPLEAHLRAVSERKGTVLLACGGEGQARRLEEMLRARKLRVAHHEGPYPLAKQGDAPGPHIALLTGAVGTGLIDQVNDVTLLGPGELFGAPGKVIRGRRRGTRRPSAQALETLDNLRIGDLVVHQDHGIGEYQGLVRLRLGGVDGDFVALTYADADKLYVPVYRLAALKRYFGSKEHARLDKLGGPRWERAKRRVRDHVLALAHTLLALQAQRHSQRGFALTPPPGSYENFAAAFAFEETVDQQAAIDATLADLARDVPMDRLVCGDVGYGKTEVALRAAFVATQAGRQVAVLVPTTVLAEQHRQTFAERLGPSGAVVESLSRFRSPKESRDVLSRVQQGAVDVLIGTHRLLSSDVHFKNLGLLVVDEEQRFGVKHKERIKQLRAQVHVLTLSATPIPRTLHMATMGLRDLSLIRTAPASRSAIRTEVMRLDFEVMREAIRRELHRGGQVFVVHNRIDGLERYADKVAALVPEAQVAIAHGQMESKSLEQIMLDFVARKTQVLVCTAIIESGIDIPSVNTMIVNRADTFGLGQLYQLRGRIGRGKERAYAYMFLPEEELLGREAIARLSLLKRFSTLGSGFEIASHDLELRGAGDLLGQDQSGHIAAVGYEMYNALLEEAVSRAKGQGPRRDVEPEINVPLSAVFAESYMPEPLDRLGFYQRMAQAQSDEQIWDVLGEVKSLFGRPPPEALALAELMVLRRRLRELGTTHLNAAWTPAELRVAVVLSPEAPIDRVHVAGLCQQEPGRYKLLPSGKLALFLPAPPAGVDPNDGSETLPSGQVLLVAIREGLAPLRVVPGTQGPK